MFRRKKKEEQTEAPAVTEAATEESSTAPAAPMAEALAEVAPGEAVFEAAPIAQESVAADGEQIQAVRTGDRGNRVQKVGIVASDKMQKTVVVRVDRLVLHQKYRRYVRRTTKFKAHDELGSGVGDRVRIVETRPLSAQKRWRVVEILQKAAK
jgi:small subunit ribosomal protein S17